MTSPQWCFDCFRLDPDNACLWHGAQAIALSPKVFAVLSYLVTHADRLVTKDELLDAVWPETAVTDAVLRVTIGALRKVLDDTARASRFIATVPRWGYRFLVPVEEYSGVMSGATGPVPSRPHRAPLPDALPSQVERRYLTVLSCGLVDSTTLAGHLDPAVFREVVRAYQQICAKAVLEAGYITDSENQHEGRGAAPAVTIPATLPRRSSRLPPTTARPSPWPRSLACARLWPTATAILGCCMPRLASASRPRPRC